jgi:hypothetical protein
MNLIAWVNFDGATGTIRSRSANVASVTRTSTGNYVVNFSPALNSIDILLDLNVLPWAWGGFKMMMQALPTVNNVSVSVESGVSAFYDPANFYVGVYA